MGGRLNLAASFCCTFLAISMRGQVEVGVSGPPSCPCEAGHRIALLGLNQKWLKCRARAPHINTTPFSRLMGSLLLCEYTESLLELCTREFFVNPFLPRKMQRIECAWNRRERKPKCTRGRVNGRAHKVPQKASIALPVARRRHRLHSLQTFMFPFFISPCSLVCAPTFTCVPITKQHCKSYLYISTHNLTIRTYPFSPRVHPPI